MSHRGKKSEVSGSGGPERATMQTPNGKHSAEQFSTYFNLLVIRHHRLGDLNGSNAFNSRGGKSDVARVVILRPRSSVFRSCLRPSHASHSLFSRARTLVALPVPLDAGYLGGPFMISLNLNYDFKDPLSKYSQGL